MFNNLDMVDLMAGLDKMEQVRALGEIKKLAEEQRDESMPLALEQAQQLYPEYAAGGKYEGKSFVHNGHTYQMQVTRDYNFANHSAEFARLKAEYDRVRREQSARTELMKALRQQILLDHPRLQPTKLSVVLKCL